MEKLKLNEESIIRRMSNGDLSALCGGTSYPQSLCDVQFPSLKSCTEKPKNPLCTCLAGCGCMPVQRACNGCTAEF